LIKLASSERLVRAAVFVLGRCEVFSAGDAEWAEMGGAFIGVNTGSEMTKLDMGQLYFFFCVCVSEWVAVASERSGVNVWLLPLLLLGQFHHVILYFL
jgi:hypothetical protein